jgi:hypothetical protein
LLVAAKHTGEVVCSFEEFHTNQGSQLYVIPVKDLDDTIVSVTLRRETEEEVVSVDASPKTLRDLNDFDESSAEHTPPDGDDELMRITVKRH